jgi:metalloendopeptidase OMA1, mitochondrial
MKICPASVLTFASALLVAGCYQVPVTGRRAMALVDDKEVTKMSVAMFDGMKKQYKISRDKDLTARLQRVGERLQQSVSIWEMPDADWEFVVFDVPKEINAFAMAGGKVGVFSGLFKIVKNDDQLASVIAHEIAHVTAKHIHEKLSRELAVNTIGMVGVIGAGAAGVYGADILGEAYGVGMNLRGFAFDREKEREADYIGLIYMARAGYDPQEAVKVLEQLEAETGTQSGAPSRFLSTHPTTPERMIQLIDAMPKALAERAKSSTAAPTVIK